MNNLLTLQVEEEQVGFVVTFTDFHVPIQSVSAPTWKSQLATELGLAMMIDDSPEVLAKMPQGTARLWLSDPEVFDLDVCEGDVEVACASELSVRGAGQAMSGPA